jgi:hypothetical protein
MGAAVERAHSARQVKLAVFLLLVVGALDVDRAAAQSARGDTLAEELRKNVVRVISRPSTGFPTFGFGFIVGERSGSVYIVTADHNVRDASGTANPSGIIFFTDQGQEYPGYLLGTRLVREAGDVAVIRAEPPAGFSWRRDVRASAPPQRHDDVWFIGLNDKWFIPAKSGAVSTVEPNRIRFEGLPVRQGTSGAPLITSKGIVGMVTVDADVYAEATPIAVIERAFAEWQYPWNLGALTVAPPPSPVVAPPPPVVAAPQPVIPSMPPDTSRVRGLSEFTTRDNRDIWLNDILRPDGRIGTKVNIDECANNCTSDAKCVAFAYDRWNQTCYPKSKITQSIVDAHSVIAVKKPAELPKVSQERISLITLRDHRMHGTMTSSKRVRKFEDCRAACDENLHCVAFNFIKNRSTDNCELYKIADNHIRDTEVDSGYKIHKR